jgi:hypothetical protein
MRMPAKKRFESEALQYTYDRFIAGDPLQEETYEQAVFDSEVASLLYRLRTKTGLSRRALARKAGTSASVICRLEVGLAECRTRPRGGAST